MRRLVQFLRVSRLLSLVALVVLGGWGRPARAGYADYDVTRARLALQRADYLLNDAQWAADVARDDFDRADRRAANLAQEVERQQREIDDAGRKFDDATRAVKWLKEDLDRKAEKAEARRKELDAANEKLRAAREALDKLTAESVAQFEAGDEFKKLTTAVEEAGKVVEAAEKASLEAFARADEHRAAVTAAEALKMRVDFLTGQGDRAAAELATAVKELADAMDRVRSLEDKHLAEDPKVEEAEQRLLEVQRVLKALRNDFDAKLGQRPEVAEARKAVAAEQQAYDDALRSLQEAEAAVATAQDELRKQDEVAALEQDRLRAANDHQNKLLDELKEADSFAAESHRRMRDALEAVEVARRERDAAAWSLARAESAADAFYAWDTPVWGFGWSVVHVGWSDCRPHYPVYVAPDCHRPTWCRPLSEFNHPWHHHRWHSYKGHGHGSWRDDHRRPVVVKVTDVRSPLHRRQQQWARETARERAVRFAGRSDDTDQRRQRQAVAQTRRQEVEQRRVRLASYVRPVVPGDPRIVAQQQTMRRAAEADAATRAAAARADRQRGQEPQQMNAARQQELRQAQQADSRQRRQLYQDLAGRRRAGGPPQVGQEGSISIQPVTGAEGRRLRWAERREQEQRRERETINPKAAAEVIAQGRMPVVAPHRDRVQREIERPQGARDDNDARQAGERQAAQQRRAEREAAEQQESRQQDAVVESRRAQRQREASAERAARDQRDQERSREQAEQQAARRQAEESRRASAQAERQQEVESRRQRQGQEASREAARESTRQQAAAAERAQRAQRESQRAAEREPQRQAPRQVDQHRVAERESARSAERQSPRAETSSRSEDRGRSSSESSRGNSRGR